MRFRSISFVIGLLLAIGAFVALFVLGQILNPPPYEVVVVVQEVAPGEVLSMDMLGVDPQSVDPRVAGEYVLRNELNKWLGAIVVEPLHPGQPLMHAHLVREDNPAAARRLALGLEDGDMVAMVIPVDEENAPQDIRAGDRVDVLYGVGDVSTSEYGALFPVQEVSPPAGATFETLAEGEETTSDLPPLWPSTLGVPTPTPRMTFPMAKACVRGARVLDVIHEEQPNPAYGGPNSGEPATIAGAVIAIQVAVPREQEEMLHYIITTGDYRVALLSPNAAVESGPTLGMTWDDLKAFFWTERERALSDLTITDTASLLGPGAAAIVATAQATPHPTPILAASPAITGTGSETETVATGPLPTTAAPPAVSPTPTAKAAGPEPTAAATRAAAPRGTASGLFNLSLLSGLVCAGGGLLLLVLLVLAVIAVLRRRRAA